jgi:predicted PhzF superfamily epimerase YddE/YHI9
MDLLASLDCLGTIVTAAGEDADFVSRFFAPEAGIPEDPVTGSAG